MSIVQLINTVNELLNSGVSLNEEATKMYLILPFLSYLGYEVNSPSEMVYEYECDMHENGSRRVDCAVIDDSRSPIILIEAKSLYEDVDKHWGQAKSYLVSSDARFAILTNGNKYVVFERSQIDGDFKSASPLYMFNLANLRTEDFEIIRKLAKINVKPICQVEKPRERHIEPRVNKKSSSISKKTTQQLITITDFLQQEPNLIGKSIHGVFSRYLSYMTANNARTVSKQEFIKQVCDKMDLQCTKKSGDSFFVDKDTIASLVSELVARQSVENIIGKSVSSVYSAYQHYSQNENSLMLSIGEFKKQVGMLLEVKIAQSGGSEYFVREDTPALIITNFVVELSLNEIANRSCSEVYQRYSTYCRMRNLFFVSQNRFCTEFISMNPSYKISTKFINGIQINFFIDKERQEIKEEPSVGETTQKRIRMTIEYLDRLLPEMWYRWSISQRVEWLKSNTTGTEIRKKVCNQEIWVEAWGEKLEQFDRAAVKEVRDVMKNVPNWIRSKNRALAFSIYGQQRYYVRAK